MQVFKIAFRNLNRNKKRSVTLAVAAAFTFFVATSALGLGAGMIKSLGDQLTALGGGNVWVISSFRNEAGKELASSSMYGEQKKLIDEALADSGLAVKYKIHRSSSGGLLIFGSKSMGSNIFGVYSDEPLLKDTVAFKEGSFEEMKKCENAIVLSELLVKEMNLALNDTLLFETTDANGKQTVAEFTLKGILINQSLISSATACYANIDYINKIQGVENAKDAFSYAAFYLEEGKSDVEGALALEKALRAKGADVTSREKAMKENPKNPRTSLNTQLSKDDFTGYRFSVRCVYDESPGYATFFTKMRLAVFAALFVLLLFTMIGVSNTFRMVVHERRREIATMRAIGASRSTVISIFLSEASLLMTIGALSGFVLSLILMTILGAIHFPATSAFSVFTYAGHIKWILYPLDVVMWLVILVGITAFIVYKTSKKSAQTVVASGLLAD